MGVDGASQRQPSPLHENWHEPSSLTAFGL